MLELSLYRLYLSDSDELVNRECLESLQMVNVFHSCVLHFPKEKPTFLLYVTTCSILMCSGTEDSPGSALRFPDRKITKAWETQDISGENNKKEVFYQEWFLSVFLYFSLPPGFYTVRLFMKPRRQYDTYKALLANHRSSSGVPETNHRDLWERIGK